MLLLHNACVAACTQVQLQGQVDMSHVTSAAAECTSRPGTVQTHHGCP
jgi:hypothetical protein